MLSLISFSQSERYYPLWGAGFIQGENTSYKPNLGAFHYKKGVVTVLIVFNNIM